MAPPQVSPKNPYRTGRHDQVKVLHVHGLQESVLCRRWAGHISSYGLALAATMNDLISKRPRWAGDRAALVAATIMCVEPHRNQTHPLRFERFQNPAN